MQPAISATTPGPHPTARTSFRRKGERHRVDSGRICLLPRDEAGALVCAGYARIYGADVREHLMPCLLGIRDDDGQIAGVFGLRSDREPFYLEHYLPQPLSAAVTAIDRHPPQRGELIELGNLVGERPGVLRALVGALAPDLDRAGYRWLACTATRELRNGLARAGADAHLLDPARPDTLPDGDATQWGTYYEHDPAVVLISIRGTVENLMRRACVRDRRAGALRG